MSKPYMTQTSIGGCGLVSPETSAWFNKFWGKPEKEKKKEDGNTTYFVNEDKGIRRLIVDKQGVIQNFPGITTEEFWTSQYWGTYLDNKVKYLSYFKQLEDGRILFEWRIQEDDRKNMSEYGNGDNGMRGLSLYSILNEDGDFDGPFRIYKIMLDNGEENYYTGEVELWGKGTFPLEIPFPGRRH